MGSRRDSSVREKINSNNQNNSTDSTDSTDSTNFTINYIQEKKYLYENANSFNADEIKYNKSIQQTFSAQSLFREFSNETRIYYWDELVAGNRRMV